MEDNELHYLTYAPDEILSDMMVAYIEAGGDTLYAGDEKEMLLQAVLAILMRAFAGVDNALRMATLRYAVRDYLELYGENRNCPIIPAKAARAVVKIEFAATGVATVIPRGTVVTEDGRVLYGLTEDLTIGGYAQTLSVDVECTQAGSVGNGLAEGAQMQFLIPVEGVISVCCTSGATGGQDKEDQEAYRERIRTYGMTSITTGPSQQYEAMAKATSSEVVDAKALNIGAGKVGVYIIPKSGVGIDALIEAVRQALSSEDKRPTTDEVSVMEAIAVPYTLNVRYACDGSSQVKTSIADAVKEYRLWQDNTIGRPFNPEKLSAMLYQAGATRVVWAEGSEFCGGRVEYTKVKESEYCKGKIAMEMMGT